MKRLQLSGFPHLGNDSLLESGKVSKCIWSRGWSDVTQYFDSIFANNKVLPLEIHLRRFLLSDHGVSKSFVARKINAKIPDIINEVRNEVCCLELTSISDVFASLALLKVVSSIVPLLAFASFYWQLSSGIAYCLLVTSMLPDFCHVSVDCGATWWISCVRIDIVWVLLGRLFLWPVSSMLARRRLVCWNFRLGETMRLQSSTPFNHQVHEQILTTLLASQNDK